MAERVNQGFADGGQRVLVYVDVAHLLDVGAVANVALYKGHRFVHLLVNRGAKFNAVKEAVYAPAPEADALQDGLWQVLLWRTAKHQQPSHGRVATLYVGQHVQIAEASPNVERAEVGSVLAAAFAQEGG